MTAFGSYPGVYAAYPGNQSGGGWGVWGYGGTYPAQPPEVPTPRDADKPVKPADLLKRRRSTFAGGSAAAGVRADTPAAGYQTFGLMSRHPTLAAAWGTVVQPILAGGWSVKIRPKEGGEPRPYKRPAPAAVAGDGVVSSEEDKRAELLLATLAPLRSYLLLACSESLNDGHSLMQVGWERRNGATVIDGFDRFSGDELQRREVEALRDDNWRFAGFRMHGNGGPQDRDPRYAFNCVNFPHRNRIFGWSNHLNVRDEWWEKVQAKARGADLDQRAAGMIAAVKGPGTDEGLAGAKKIAETIDRMGIPYFPKTTIDDDDLTSSQMEVAEYHPYEIEVFNIGDKGPSQNAILEKCRYLDTELLAGWYLAALAVQEAQFGTRAQATVHQSANTRYSELCYAAWLEQLNAGPVRMMCLTNWGPGEADRYYLEPDPLEDPYLGFLQSLITARQTNPAASAADAPLVDTPALYRRAQVPTVPGAVPAETATDGGGGSDNVITPATGADDDPVARVRALAADGGGANGRGEPSAAPAGGRMFGGRN